jgi:hypothetical protein
MNASYAISRWLLLNIALGFALALSACGGGGGSSGGGTTLPPSPGTYSVSATAGQGGSVSPTSRSVTSGQTTSFTLTANTGYRINTVSGCSGSLAGNLYTTGTVTADCAVTASFTALPTYSVTSRASAGGSISAGSASVTEGATTHFTVTPDTGYRIASVAGCGGTLKGNIFTTAPVTAACVVDANFDLQQFTVNTEVIGPGGLSPTTATVNYGQDAIFYQTQIVNGYSLELLPGCNARWEDGGIKASTITENCTVRIRYVPVEYEITAAAEGDGSISPSKVSARYGDELRFTIQPGAGNRFSYSKGCDGYFDSDASVFIIPSVTDTCQLQVSFRDERYVYFADPALEQKVREALAIAPEQLILPGEMEKLEYLEAASSRIKQLDGLEYAKNLKRLSLEYNQITNLRPLANLALQSLSISGNPITDQQLAFLSQSPLQNLYMDSTNVTDLSSLAGKTQLSYLSIQYTQVTDLTPLQQLGNLDILQAMYTSVADISPLLSAGLRKLTSVSLGGCLISQGFSRARPVVDALQEKGIFVTLESPRVWDQQKCPINRAIKNVLLSGNLSNGELELNWQVISDDPGPWRCELHLNLDSQLPRLPTKVIENCHTQTSIRLPGFNLNEYSPSLRVDTGIYGGRMTSAPANIVSANKPQTASLHSYDWAQTLLKTNPLLVAGKDANLRLHVTAQSSSPVPVLEVYAELAGKREMVPVTPPTALPTGKRHGERDQSFYSQIPARLMQPGLKVDVLLEGSKLLTLTPAFSKVRGIQLQLVPFQVGEQISALPDDTLIRNSLTRYWPLGEIQISRRAPYQLSKPAGKNTTNSMLNELADLRAVENGTAYYYGYYDPQLNSDWNSGLGFMPGMVAVGINNPEGIDTVLAHELGHNFSLPHAPCGSPSNPDIEYPYNFGATGSYGTDQGYTTIFNPELKDVMGYCGGGHVSDHNYEKAQDYLDKLAGQPYVINTVNADSSISARKPSAATTTNNNSSLYLRIAVTGSGASIAQQIALPHLPALPANSKHRAQVEFADGSQQELPIALLQLGHGSTAGEYQLQLAIPTHEKKPLRLTLLEGQKPLLEHKFTTASAPIKKGAAAQSLNTRDTGNLTTQNQLQYRNNEVCVARDVSDQRHANLIWHHTDGVIALALNETASHFCRVLGDLPTGEAELQLF